jgi:mycofactocin precursor
MTEACEQSVSLEAMGQNESEPEAPGEVAEALDDGLVEADLLVEDVSIDGMCGVY